MLQTLKEKGLNANQLKLIAIAAMTLDHLTWTLFPGYSTEWFVVLFHIIGRLTAPIMWFFIAEGYHYTHDIKKYAGRLFLLAAISHFAYNFCFGIPFIPFQTSVFNQTGVVWSLAWGLVLLYIHDKAAWKAWQKLLVTIIICLITFPADWSCIATMAIFAIGMNRGNFKKQMTHMMLCTLMYAIVYFIFIDKLYAIIQLGTCLTIPLLYLYNGQRGSMKGIGRLFYIYYPLHLVICGLIRILLWGAAFSTGTANF
ncbi:MAG: conjugal transfer protein TraX [Ruminococcus sp.]|nr:conjugal transfer protein TraX [Ruminococcus sp.]